MSKITTLAQKMEQIAKFNNGKFVSKISNNFKKTQHVVFLYMILKEFEQSHSTTLIRWGSVDHSPFIPTISKCLTIVKHFSFYKNESWKFTFIKKGFEKEKYFAKANLLMAGMSGEKLQSIKRPRPLYRAKARYKVGKYN